MHAESASVPSRDCAPPGRGTVDVHQHLWPATFVEALRSRSEPPRLDGWLLHTDFEPPFAVNPRDHDLSTRLGQDPDLGRALLSLSAPLGIESLPADQATPLLDAWHDGLSGLAADSRGRIAGWASVSRHEPDLSGLQTLLSDRPEIVGLQVPATWMTRPGDLDSIAETLAVCADADRPVLVHPGPAQPSDNIPDWWPAVVDYTAQLQAAWWAWRAVGRHTVPGLRICFVAGAGLAPALHERFVARSGQPFVVHPNDYVETSSCGRQGVDALVRALGIDAVVLGTDRPYAEPAEFHLGAAATHAITITNPARLLGRHTLEVPAEHI